MLLVVSNTTITVCLLDNDNHHKVKIDQLMSPSVAHVLCPAWLCTVHMRCSIGILQQAGVHTEMSPSFHVQPVRVHSHGHKSESKYRYTGSSKHEFACISMVAVHTDTSSVQYGLPVNFTHMSNFCAGRVFIQTI